MEKLPTLNNIEIEKGFDSLMQYSDTIPHSEQYHRIVNGWKGKAVLVEDIRELAVEWLKALDNGYCYTHSEYHMDDWTDENECTKKGTPQYNILCSWIWDFFNITQEDLQDD